MILHRLMVTIAAACLGAAGCSNPADNPVDPDAPANLTVLAGAAQQASVLATLPSPIAVLVTDQDGDAVVGATVRFIVTTGGGGVSPDSATTDGDGIAITSWTLGAASGNQILTIRVSRPGEPLVETVTALARVAGTVELTAGGGQTMPRRSSLPDAITVLVRDTTGSPLAGALVVFAPSGTGAVSEDSVLSSGTGVAATSWRLGDAPGEQTLDVSVVRPGRSAVSLTVYATALNFTRTMLTGEPYGVALTATRLAVTRLAASRLALGSVSSRTVPDTVIVGSAPTGVAINPAGTEAYVTNQFSRTVSVINVATRADLGSFSVANDPYVVAFAPDGARAYVTTNVGMVYEVNTATRAVVDSVMTGSASNGLAFSADATRLYVSAFAAGAVYEVDLATFTVARTFTTGGIPQGIAVSTDGAELYVANQAGRIEVWNLAAGTHTTNIVIPGTAFGLARSPDGSRLAVGTVYEGLVVLVNPQTRSIVSTTNTGGSPRRLAFTTDGQSVVVANLSGWLDFIP